MRTHHLAAIEFLKNFTFFKKAWDTGCATSEYTDFSLSIQQNVFGCPTFSFCQQEYVLTDEAPVEEFFEQFFQPILDHLELEELYLLFKHSLDLPELFELPVFHDFLRNRSVHCEESEDYLDLTVEYINPVTEFLFFGRDLQNELDALVNKLPADEAIEQFADFETTFALQNDEYSDFMTHWFFDPKQRLKELLLPRPSNEEFTEGIRAFFQKMQCFEWLAQHPLYEKHYSTPESLDLAFNIKVYESFVHEGLRDLGVLHEDDEYENRRDAIAAFYDSLSMRLDEHPETANTLGDYHIYGNSGGYLALSFDWITLPLLEVVTKEIELAKEGFYQGYQRLENYEYVRDTLEEKIIQLREQQASLEEAGLPDDNVIEQLTEATAYLAELDAA